MRVRKSSVLALLVAVLAATASAAPALEVGDPAPSFAAESTAGPLQLADYQGKKNVLLAFYFKDFTGG
jgi:P pilus assembly chaperone PapD